MTPSTAGAGAPALPAARGLNLAAGLVGAAVLLGLGAWVVVASVQQDFAAYYTAGRARALGLDPYVNHVGGPWDGLAIYRHSRFLYPPLLAELFRPLAALPFAWAKALFTGFSLLALLAALRITSACAGRRPRPAGLTLLAVAAWPPVFLALERGQIDLLLLPLLAAAWRMRSQRSGLAGACLALCALAKPPVLAVLPVALLVTGRRAVGLTAATLAGVGLLLGAGALLSGAASSRRYVTEVLPRAALYGEGGPEDELLDSARFCDAANDLESGIARVDGRTYAQGLGELGRNASLARWLTPDGDAPPRWLSLIIFGALAGGLATMARRQPEAPGWFWGALLVGVLAAPVSWAMSLTWALPLLQAWLAPAPSRAPSRAVRWGAATTFGLGFLGLATPAGWVLAGLAAVTTAALASRAATEGREIAS